MNKDLEVDIQEYRFEDFNKDIHNIVIDIKRDNKYYDYICGINRGGLIPAVALSHKLGVPHYPLLPYPKAIRDFFSQPLIMDNKFLIVDEICDSGKVLSTIHTELEELGLDRNVDFAVLLNNTEASFTVDYFGLKFKRSENKKWFKFFWEQ